ncbi:MAG: HPr family phosphocarrier protein, partial [Selenomonadaceae bacterium]|nr:HPr family phosphocarrier protein [Selenomonadaceae bacterium]
MDELRQYLSPEEIRELDSSGNADDYGYNVSIDSGTISGERGDYFAEGNIVILNRTGIHARPASVFVQTASKFKSKVQIKAKGKTVDAKSILMIMSMGLTKGTEITLS